MMGQFGGRGGRGGHGPHGGHGHGPHGGRGGGRGGCGMGGGKWKHMLNQFMGGMGKDAEGNFNAEEFGKKMGELGKQFGNQWQQNGQT